MIVWYAFFSRHLLSIHLSILFLFKNLVEQNYRERIAELADQNERKDLRIKLLEQKLQKLQVSRFFFYISVHRKH